MKQWVGPALAGIIMIRITGGKPGLSALKARIRQWRVDWLWYLFILLAIPALVLLGLILLPDKFTHYQGFSPRLLMSFPVYFAGIFFATGLPEEIGWRGFAFPRLQKRFGPLKSSLLLGTLWAFWHLSSFLSPAHGGGPGASLVESFTNFIIFFGMVIALTFCFTWVYNHTRGSILIAALVHTAVDVPQLVLAPAFLEVGTVNSTAGEMALNLAYLFGFGLLAFVILIITRGRLGYKPDSTEGSEEI
jgi:membrane protease YdiL (CAAX protease family)